MKNSLFIIICLLSCFGFCHAQSDSNYYHNGFVNELEFEINENNGFNEHVFSDTVKIVLKNKTINAFKRQTKKEYWLKIKGMIKGTDYVINMVDTIMSKRKYVITIMDHRLKYYRLNNHVYGYIIGINEHGLISVIQEEFYNNPSSPKNKGHHH